MAGQIRTAPFMLGDRVTIPVICPVTKSRMHGFVTEIGYDRTGRIMLEVDRNNWSHNGPITAYADEVEMVVPQQAC